MWVKWFPWRFLIKRLARGHGLLDPLKLISQFQRFAQPSEVAVPVEILRLALILHARGLINSQAIQHNLDWVWPYWVERQFDPHDAAFMPRAFSLSHINLTHRNWTAVGIPGCPDLPIVDPAGLVTPFWDSWSVDSWLLPESGPPLIPSRLTSVSQKLVMDKNFSVVTESGLKDLHLVSSVEVYGNLNFPVCRIHLKAFSERKGLCAVALRPYNPEGVSFIHRINALGEHHGWKVDGKYFIYFNQLPDRCLYSDYRQGDVFHFLPHARHREKIICDVGMATAAAVYELMPGIPREITLEIPLQGHDGKQYENVKHLRPQDQWTEPLIGSCRLNIPDKKFQFLYEAALRTMVLHAPKEIYPGPYTYKHFWFRDAAFILQAMLCAGLRERAEKVINSTFFSRQTASGYFHSQDGEWDSNGQALWTLMRFCQLTGSKPPEYWKKAVKRGAEWIVKKRTRKDLNQPHAGLLPAGFSAEHLGPNDYYYWDDFWGAAGLKAAAYFAEHFGKKEESRWFEDQSGNFLKCIDQSLETVHKRLGHLAMPASPYRRMDTGAIGSLAAGYPLELWEPGDRRLLATVEYLIQECLVDGGFFHDMSHSGINPYLTLHIAQILLRAGDPRYYGILRAIADLASPTGQWPEAINPKTKGGCMGDGQHVWAAAEWVMMVRNCFVREENDKLILFSGIPALWFEKQTAISFGPAATQFGKIHLRLEVNNAKIKASWEGEWFLKQPEIEIHLPGHGPVSIPPGHQEIEILPAAAK